MRQACVLVLHRKKLILPDARPSKHLQAAGATLTRKRTVVEQVPQMERAIVCNIQHRQVSCCQYLSMSVEGNEQGQAQT